MVEGFNFGYNDDFSSIHNYSRMVLVLFWEMLFLYFLVEGFSLNFRLWFGFWFHF
jgi:hypothetical protein